MSSLHFALDIFFYLLLQWHARKYVMANYSPLVWISIMFSPFFLLVLFSYLVILIVCNEALIKANQVFGDDRDK